MVAYETKMFPEANEVNNLSDIFLDPAKRCMMGLGSMQNNPEPDEPNQ